MEVWQVRAMKSRKQAIEIVLPKMIELGWFWFTGKVVQSKGQGPSGIFQTDVFEVMHANIEVRRLAIRVQEVNRSYDSFTMRTKRTAGGSTEIDRLWEADRTGKIEPFYIAQAYVHSATQELLAIGLMETREFIHFFKLFKSKGVLTNPEDGNGFQALFWKGMSEKEAQTLKVWKAPKKEDTCQKRFKF